MNSAPASLGYRILAKLHALGDTGALRIEALSPTVLVGTLVSGSFEPGDRVSLRIVGGALEVGPLEGTVDASEAHESGQRLIIALGPLSLLTGRAVLALLETLRASNGLEEEPPRLVTEVVRDPKRVVSIIRQIFELKCESRFFATDDDADDAYGLWAKPDTLVPGSARPLVWNAEPPCPSPPFDVHVSWMNWDFRFRVDEAVTADGRVHTSLPTEILRVRERFQRRAPAPKGASLCFRHPQWPSLSVRQPLHDVSLNGVSFASACIHDGVFLGLELPLVEVAWPTGELVRFQATVRRITALGQEGVVAGVSLVPLDHENAQIWRKIIDRVFYQHTTQENPRADPLWELYEKSGYFNLSGKTEQEFSDLRHAFQRVTKTFGHPNDVGAHLVLGRGEHAQSAITVLKPYEHSWFPCQLAQEKGTGAEPLSTRRVLLEVMLHAFEYLMRDPGFRWVVNWVQTDSRFSRSVSYDLTARIVKSPEEACLLPFRAMEGRTDEGPGPDAFASYDVGPASESEVGLLLDAIARCRPVSYCESHDLVPERVHIRGVERRWRAAGLVRRRHIVIAREGGVPLAGGVMDLVEDGVHLFGLFDVLRTFAIQPGGERAFGAIVEAARAWYRGEGKLRFAYFVEHEDYQHAERAGMKDLGGADLVVMSSYYMPDQMQHVWELMAPRDRPPLRREPDPSFGVVTS